MTIESFATLSDGTLIDFAQGDDGTLTIRAGRTLDPAERPVILTLQREDANEIGLHLTAFVINRELLSGPVAVTRDPESLSIQCPLCDWSARNEAEDPDAAAQIEPHLQRAFLAHLELHMPKLRTIEDVLHDQADADTAYALFTTMRTPDLELLAEAHRNDERTMTSPEGIAFVAGRQALIRHVLKQRALDAAGDVFDGRVQGLASEVEDGTRGPIEIVLRPAVALQLALLLQVALRHPFIRESDNTTARAGRTVFEHLRRYFADAPTIQAVLNEGEF